MKLLLSLLRYRKWILFLQKNKTAADYQKRESSSQYVLQIVNFRLQWTVRLFWAWSDLPVGVSSTTTIDEKVALVMSGVVKPGFMRVQATARITIFKTIHLFIIIITDLNNDNIIIFFLDLFRQPFFNVIIICQWKSKSSGFRAWCIPGNVCCQSSSL